MPVRWARLAICVGLAFLCATQLASAAEARKPTLFIVGDSTVRNGTKGQQGWGERIGSHFDLQRINVENRAIGGRSSRTFITEGRWDKVLAAARPGDFVLIQFGHNDSGAPDDPKRPRGTLRGTGDDTREIIHPTTQKPETVHTYGWYLRKYIADARAKKMTPILCSPVPRVPGSKLVLPLAPASGHALWAADVAQAERVALIDLNALISSRYVGMDPAAVKSKYFCEDDNTHTSPAGAELNAAVVATRIRELDGCRLSGYLLPGPVKVP